MNIVYKATEQISTTEEEDKGLHPTIKATLKVLGISTMITSAYQSWKAKNEKSLEYLDRKREIWQI